MLVIASLSLSSCGIARQRIPNDFSQSNQQEPALSGNGQKLALIVDQLGRPTVQVKNLVNGKKLSLRHLSRNQPHSSPSLSWNGRYLAIITQRGTRRIAVIEDLVTGRYHTFPLFQDKDPYLLSLAPSGARLAVQIVKNGKWQVQIFDLSQVLEPDKPSGIIRQTNL